MCVVKQVIGPKNAHVVVAVVVVLGTVVMLHARLHAMVSLNP